MGNRGKNFNNNALIWAIVLFAAIGSLDRAFADKTITGDLTVTGDDISTPAAMNLKPSGDLDDYLSHTTVSNVPTTTINGKQWEIDNADGSLGGALVLKGTSGTFLIGWVEATISGVLSSSNAIDIATVTGDITLTPGGGSDEVNIESVLDMTDHAIKAIGYLAFDIDAVPPGNEGDTGWNDTFKTLDLHAGDGPVLQVGHETVARGFNDLGTTIIDGTVLFPIGSQGVFIKGGRAKADTHVTISGPIVMATQDIADQGNGRVTIFGNVSDVDTSLFSNGITFTLGDVVYVDPDFEGEFTNVRPTLPDYNIRIGRVLAVAGSTVTVAFAQSTTFTDTLQNFFNGTFRETINFTVASNGTTITGTLAPDNGHDDMTMLLSSGFELFDTSPSATVTLTAGADDNPQDNFVYILQSDTSQMVTASSWPTAEHVKVAHVVLRTAATTQIDGALRNQNWNNHNANTTTFQGQLDRVNTRLRQEHAKWDNGVAGSITIDSALSPDGVYVETTGGQVYQIGIQDFPLQSMVPRTIDAVSTGSETFTISDDGDLSSTFPDGRIIQVHNSTGNDGLWTIASTVWSSPDFIITVDEDITDATADGVIADDIHVTNRFTASEAYTTIIDLSSETTDASNVSLTNRHFSFVVWGVQNRSGQVSHLMVNLPTNSYSSSASAIADGLNYSVRSIDSQFEGVGFLIARFTFHLSASGGGTWTLSDTEVLLGDTPGATGGGGGGGGVTTFLQLSDTPNAYTSQALKLFQVNAGETATEFTSTPTITADNISDGGGNAIITTTQETNFETAFTHVTQDGSSHSLLSATPGTAEASIALIVGANLDLDIGFGDRTDVGNYDGSIDPTAITDQSETLFWELNGDLTATTGGAALVEVTGPTAPEFLDRGTYKAWKSDGVLYFKAAGVEGPLGSAARTTLAWVKTEASDFTHSIIDYGGAGTGGAWNFAIGTAGDDILFVGVGGGSAVSPINDPRLIDGEWHLFAASFDTADGTTAGDIILTIDCDVVATTADATTINTITDTDTYVGARANGANETENPTGLVAVFNVALTPAQLQNIFDRTKPRTIGGSVNGDIDWTNADTALVTSKSITAGGLITAGSILSGDFGVSASGDVETIGSIKGDNGFIVGSFTGVTTTFVIANGDTVTVKGGIITDISP